MDLAALNAALEADPILADRIRVTLYRSQNAAIEHLAEAERARKMSDGTFAREERQTRRSHLNEMMREAESDLSDAMREYESEKAQIPPGSYSLRTGKIAEADRRPVARLEAKIARLEREIEALSTAPQEAA